MTLVQQAARLAAAFVALALFAGAAAAQQPVFPFGSHKQRYAAGAMRPTTALATLDQQTRTFYDQWKARYLKTGCATGQAYVKADTGFGAMVVSEGQGYGMLIVALMAGHDPNARTLFDALYRYKLAHPSAIEPDLMEWAQNAQCQTFNSSDSATDGDLDIAYALLLADKQWGSTGAIDYKAQARRMVIAIKRGTVNSETNLTTLGDWVTVAADPKFKYASRSSDWMTDHFRAFARKIGPNTWTPVLDAHYRVIGRLLAYYDYDTGLLPDFVVNTQGSSPRRAPPMFLESNNDGNYNYNACRDPWRIGIDAAISGDARAKGVVRRMSSWIRNNTAGKPALIRDGYQLNGRALQDDYNTMAFIAPFAVAAISDPDAQSWINSLWVEMARRAPEGYYPDSIRLLSMIAVSRNWLTP